MKRDGEDQSGKLKIGDHWNVISIIALSQNNPLKAHRRVRGKLDRRGREERDHRSGEKQERAVHKDRRRRQGDLGLPLCRHAYRRFDQARAQAKGRDGASGRVRHRPPLVLDRGRDLHPNIGGRRWDGAKHEARQGQSLLRHIEFERAFRPFGDGAPHRAHPGRRARSLRRQDPELPGLRAQGPHREERRPHPHRRPRFTARARRGA